MSNFEELLNTLSNIKGKFLLSSYDYEELDAMAKKHNWYQIKKEMIITACKGDAGKGRTKKKIEVFTSNYPLI